ncbi:hypothetical protein LC613_43405 [Nostoc sphaeroides CHAB 2801]|uniref:hypothetical protein n=1 Tax=Nostoc sphaeroides TaxID=446679 RepID=UPI001E4801E7|nr:hypothetical protein [Nostoc sphaeroides]MCC5634251.1 hypothetical protein [Nostoc sphaeroides CHAB 2801]
MPHQSKRSPTVGGYAIASGAAIPKLVLKISTTRSNPQALYRERIDICQTYEWG